MATRVRRIAWQLMPEAVASEVDDAGIYIVGAKRTPIGGMGGGLVDLRAQDLGAKVIRASLEASGVAKEDVQECFMGNVLSAGLGQAPARQAALLAGLPVSTCCTTINKVCASGLKAVTMGAQSIALGHADVVVAGGMESMSNAPYYLTGQARAGRGLKYGEQKILDGMAFDGLTDPATGEAMGVFGELCAREHNISRADQDAFAAISYRRAQAAHAVNAFSNELIKVSVGKKGPVVADEEHQRGRISKFPELRPAFEAKGTVTAASSSTISDGAAALVLASAAKVRSGGLRPLARILSYADAEQEPERFTTTVEMAIRKAVERARLRLSDVDYFEINEAFAVVVLANMKLLGLDPERVNVLGGACSLGHPIGASGARILVTLCTVLHERGARYGVAAICNGGGGATAVVVERCR